MSHSITIKLNRAANEFQAGESTGFGIGGGVQYYDRDLKDKAYTNYKAVIFAKAPGQIEYYRNYLVKDAVVEVGAKQQKISEYNGKFSIEFIDAWIGSINQSAPRVDNQNNQNYQQQAAQGLGPKVEHVANSQDNFDDDIPF